MAAPGPAGASASSNAGGAAAPHWLAGGSLLVSGGLGSLGVLFGLWAMQQVITISKELQILAGCAGALCGQ